MDSAEPSRLETLPVEIVETIVRLLELQDICSLRELSRTVAAKSSQGVFKTFFAAKTVEWALKGELQKFVQLTQPNQMGCLVQHLTILGTASIHNQKHPSDKLLRKAFANLRLNSPYKGLVSINLRVHGRDFHGNSVPCVRFQYWRQTWIQAARTFEMTCRILASTALPVQELDIFFDKVLRCSLASDAIGPVLDSVDVRAVLQKLKRLSLNLSHAVPLYDNPWDAADEMNSGLEDRKSHTDDICRLLRLCPELQVLELRWHNLVNRGINEAQREERQFFIRVAQLEQFSKLQQCRLQGMYTDEASLLAFLKTTTQLRRLHLEKLTLVDKSERFTTAFHYLTRHMPQLEYLHLDALYEYRIICFPGAPGTPHYQMLDGGPEAPFTLTLTGEGLHGAAIAYRVTRGHRLISPAYSSWRRKNDQMYGPRIGK